MAKASISRRDLFKFGGLTAAAAGAGMLAGCGKPEVKVITGEGASGAQGAQSGWRVAPEEVTSFIETVTCDVVVVGTGFSGVTAFRELAEEGYNVHLVEKQKEENYAAVGNEFASLNATILQERGVPHIDPVDFFQNWVRITGNAVNQELVMKFAQNSGATSDWYLDSCTEEDFATMTTAFFPKTENQLDELGGIKFWPSVCSFYGGCNQTKLQGYNRAKGVAAGGTVHWAESGYYVIMDGGKVAGLVTETTDGYKKYLCRAVVLATGGFGGNQEMLNDLMYDVYGNLVGDESVSSMSNNDGAGIRMAYWAGAHLETTPIPGMNFRGLSVPGKMNCLPQAVWIDEHGKRFCNEFYPTSEQRGLQTVLKSRKTKFAVVDDDFTYYRTFTIPQHAGFTASEENISSLRESLDTAYAKFNGTYVESETTDSSQSAMPEGAMPMGAGEGGPEGGPGGGGGGPMGAVSYIADDTLEGLADQMGLDAAAKKEFLAQIERYNGYCEAGADQEFGRDAKVLFPVKKAPFYACTFDPVLGETMVTCGGIITDGDQCALDKDFEPIPGLYVSGNDCGKRFGYEYITPIPGVSLGLAIVLGRECGKSVGKFLA